MAGISGAETVTTGTGIATDATGGEIAATTIAAGSATIDNAETKTADGAKTDEIEDEKTRDGDIVMMTVAAAVM